MRETRIVSLDSYEHRVMVAVLNAFRNNLLEEDKPTEDVDSLLLKTIDAPFLKERKKKVS